MFLIQSFHLMVVINMVFTPNATQLTFITEAHTYFYISLNVDCDVKTHTVVGVRGKRQENSPHHQQVHDRVRDTLASPWHPMHRRQSLSHHRLRHRTKPATHYLPKGFRSPGPASGAKGSGGDAVCPGPASDALMLARKTSVGQT
jgi:hypothetical protein